MIDFTDISDAYNRIKPYIKSTPLMESNLLNDALGHRIIFKVEALQKTGSYKIRGALNAIVALEEKNNLPENIVAYSSGNHAQAVAYASKLFNIKSTIFMPSYTSYIKQESAKKYGANIILTESRIEAEAKVLEAEAKGYYNLHPSSNDYVITANGTICLEAFEESKILPNSIFAACGGGGLLSGSLISCRNASKDILVYGGEPQVANDVARSLRDGKIFRFDKTPNTIADGARTLSITEKNFEYIKKIDGLYEVSEEEILYWNMWLMHLLKITCEPTAALAMAAAGRWLVEQNSKKTIIVILSGGNIDPATYLKIWEKDYLKYFPSNEQITAMKYRA